jgi:hypothetical protein
VQAIRIKKLLNYQNKRYWRHKNKKKNPNQATLEETMSNPVEPSALERKVARRLLWILVPAMLVAFMDRINISFAAPTMNPALGIDAATFGLGAGIFFLGYMLFEVPSNLVLAHVGARYWIAGFTTALLSGAILKLDGVRLAALGIEPVYESPEEFGNFIKREVARNAELLKAADFKPM